MANVFLEKIQTQLEYKAQAILNYRQWCIYPFSFSLIFKTSLETHMYVWSKI